MKKLILFLIIVVQMVTMAKAQGSEPERIVGGDISLLPQYEKHCKPYLDFEGKKIDDLITWLTGECGWNAFRVRLFVNPTGKGNDGTSYDPSVCQDLDYVKALGKRIKDSGAKFMLDFHYSDTWVDAGHIQAPEACKGMTVDQKSEWIASYTKESLNALKTAGATPDYVQVGNEIMAGFMGIKVNSWDNTGSWDDYLKVLKAAAKATREACPAAKIIIHTDRPGDKQSCTNYYTQVKNAGIDYDIIGLSYYPFWHGTLNDLKTGLNTLKNLFADKEIQIVETAYYMQNWPTSGINYDTRNVWKANEAGQYGMIKDLIATLDEYQQVTGLMYWCPEEAGTGDDWDTYKKNTVMDGWINRGLWWPSVGGNDGHWPVANGSSNVHKLLKSFLTTSALAGVQAANGSYEMFDILGKPINTVPSRGMFIRNGKVVIVK